MVVNSLDTGSLSMTEPHHAPIFDTGPHPDPIPPIGDDPGVDYTPLVDSSSLPSLSGAADEPVHVDLGSAVSSAPLPLPAQPVAVPGQFQFAKRWKFALLLTGVWIAAGAAGVGLFYFWFHSFDKTWPDFGVLVYVVVCVVAALLFSMAETRPTVSALAMGIMTAPYASACAAAVLYGAYAFGWVAP
jgi:hypothetical protein